MDFAALKEKLRSLSPLELLKKLREFLPDLPSNLPSLVKGFGRRSTGSTDEDSSDDDIFDDDSSDEGMEGETSFFVRNRRLMLFGLAGLAAVLVFLIIIVTVINTARPDAGDFFVADGVSIPADEFFFPSEPDFLPPFLPERAPRRFWTLDDIRIHWRTLGNPDWWMGEIKKTVDSIMEGVP